MENSKNTCSTEYILRWYSTIAGQWLAQRESDLLGQVLPGLFGYHLLAVGLTNPDSALASSPIRHRITVRPSGKGENLDQVDADLMDLPFQNDSIDVVVLSHMLECSTQPHSILREAERVIRPDGYLAILAFNPLSLYGLSRLMLGSPLRSQKYRKPPWRGHYYGVTRLRDWLQLLGFDVVRLSYCAFLPPIQHEATLRHLTFIEDVGKRYFPLIGGVSLLVARNQVVTPTVIKPRWRPKKALIDSGVIEPTNRIRK